MRRYDDAIRAGETAIAINPNDAEALNGLGVGAALQRPLGGGAALFRTRDGAKSFVSRHVAALSGTGLLSIATIRGSRIRPEAADLPNARDRRLARAPGRDLRPDGPLRRGARAMARGRSASTPAILWNTGARCCPIRTQPISRRSSRVSGRREWSSQSDWAYPSHWRSSRTQLDGTSPMIPGAAARFAPRDGDFRRSARSF